MKVSAETWPSRAALPQFLGADMNNIFRSHRPIGNCQLRTLAVKLGQ